MHGIILYEFISIGGKIMVYEILYSRPQEGYLKDWRVQDLSETLWAWKKTKTKRIRFIQDLKKVAWKSRKGFATKYLARTMKQASHQRQDTEAGKKTKTLICCNYMHILYFSDWQKMAIRLKLNKTIKFLHKHAFIEEV